MKRIRVGIIGQGRSGRNIHRYLIDTHKDLPEMFELVGVADPIAERRKFPEAISISPDFPQHGSCSGEHRSYGSRFQRSL